MSRLDGWGPVIWVFFVLCLEQAGYGQTAPIVPGVAWPTRPVVDPSSYPACNQDYMSKNGAFAKASAARQCRGRLEAYNINDLNSYAYDIKDYAQRLLEIDKSVRSSQLKIDVKIVSKIYVQNELRAFRTRDSSQPGGIANRSYYRFFLQYHRDVAELTRVINHYSPGREQ